MTKKRAKRSAAAGSKAEEPITRKRGPIFCEPDSDEAKRIEETHGFNAAAKAQADAKDAAQKERDGETVSDKGDA